jgi:hypothetical protein
VQDREHGVDVNRSAFAAVGDEQAVSLSVGRNHGAAAIADFPRCGRPFAHLPNA